MAVKLLTTSSRFYFPGQLTIAYVCMVKGVGHAFVYGRISISISDIAQAYNGSLLQIDVKIKILHKLYKLPLNTVR